MNNINNNDNNRDNDKQQCQLQRLYRFERFAAVRSYTGFDFQQDKIKTKASKDNNATEQRMTNKIY